MPNEPIRREYYLNTLHGIKGRELVKVIMGVRRCGKSTLMEMFKDDIKKSGVPDESIFYINFEEAKNESITDGGLLLKAVADKVELKEGTYVFIDELPDLPGWGKAVNSMRYSGADVYITGSNSKLLLSNFSSELHGRYVIIEMFPLSFREFVEFINAIDGEGENNLDKLLIEYMKSGGLPLAVLERENKKNVDMILSGIFHTIFLKDIVERNTIKDVTGLRRILDFVMSNIGNLTSIESIANYIGSKGSKTTSPTIDNYVYYMEEARLIHRAKKYDVKKKEYLISSGKIYISDLGIRNNRVGYDDNDIAGLMENMVYMELLFRGKEAAVGKINDNEVDFIVIGTEKKEYYQVTTDLLDPKVKEREVEH